jgi:hypothetical protein
MNLDDQLSCTRVEAHGYRDRAASDLQRLVHGSCHFVIILALAALLSPSGIRCLTLQS